MQTLKSGSVSGKFEKKQEEEWLEQKSEKKNVVVTGDEIHPGAMGISETC